MAIASSVTSGALHQLPRTADSGSLHELAAQRGAIRRRAPLHVENMLARPQMLGWCAVTFDAPLHVERSDPPREWHLVDSAVARDAAHALRNVNAVIEVDEIRQIVHALPSERLSAAKRG